MGKPKIVCLCGSTRFSPLFAAVVLNPKYGYRGTALLHLHQKIGVIWVKLSLNA